MHHHRVRIAQVAAACAPLVLTAPLPAKSIEVITLTQDDLAFNRCVTTNSTAYAPRDWPSVIPEWADLDDDEREYRKAVYMQEQEDAARRRAEELCKLPKP
jgi:hypothetical protein